MTDSLKWVAASGATIFALAAWLIFSVSETSTHEVFAGTIMICATVMFNAFAVFNHGR